jgi:hypothetical protein
MKKKIIFLFAMLSVMLSAQTLAASQWCNGTISRTYVGKDGTVFVYGTWRNDYTAVCSVNAIRDGVAPEVCKSWLSLIITGKTTKTPMIIHYTNAPACNVIPTYTNAPSPVYVMLAN